VYELARYLQFAKPDTDSSIDWNISGETYLTDVDETSISGLVVSDNADVQLGTTPLPISHVRYQTLSGPDTASIVQRST